MDKEAIAADAIEIQKAINTLVADLDVKKNQLREIANGNTLKITVSGLGEVRISAPRAGGEKTGTRLKINEERLNLIPDLKKKLFDKKVLIEEDVISSPAAASVTIKPNV